jgi:hypothetical protein
VTVAFAPNRDLPLDVVYEMNRCGERIEPAWFAHSAIRDRFRGGPRVATLGLGVHFLDSDLPWNAWRRENAKQ